MQINVTEDHATGTASRFINWHPERDALNIKTTAVELRHKSARHQYDQFRQYGRPTTSDIVFWRRKALDYFELAIQRPFSGRVIEIGAGAGWCSAVLSRRPAVREVFALDYEAFCVKDLMPRTHSLEGADVDKITRVLGSYNSMECGDGYFDFVVSMGALHHSEDLQRTMQECARVLTPGGYLFALERCGYNSLTRNAERYLEHRLVSAEKLKHTYGPYLEPGTRIAENDYSNHFYRLFEYECSALRAGFDPTAIVFDHSVAGGLRLLALRVLRPLRRPATLFSDAMRYRGFYKPVLYPFFARGAYTRRRPTYDRLMLIAQKPLNENRSAEVGAA